jgi:hypothetical protein
MLVKNFNGKGERSKDWILLVPTNSQLEFAKWEERKKDSQSVSDR